MTTNTTSSIVAVKSNKRTLGDSIVLQSLPPGLAEVPFDFPLLLRATGLWAVLSRQQRNRAKRMAPRLVAFVDPSTRCITGYLSLPKIAQRRR
ncbi:hypothetical protein GFL72_16850 [Rhizobium leguminosarum bv. viciae]|uniref:hypothetical protein n=1 Tax=Rhizobium leguminosarum TaxID=384 RepID=UPI0014429A69|nr:hypothetical protein [Rhizobium leguminosarum]NKK36296.1 hypothetical protein [Rhizobium leguminosarum bv. viciae]